MEHHIDKHLVQFRHNLDHYSDTGEPFDLKELIAFFVLDVLGDLAFRTSFNSQVEQDVSKLPPINDHIFLACLLDIATCEAAIERSDGRLLDPETGARLTELDIQTEAFAFIVAGSHTTSGTLTLLFSHILQNPAIYEKVVHEVDSQLDQIANEIVPANELETILPYTMACLNENFRINPVFTMPLERRVTMEGGFEIEGHIIPKGTVVFSLNHVVHHNPDIWGAGHDVFDPSRFLGPKSECFKRYLSPFSIGHRMCIGRNMAMVNMLKLISTTFKYYHLEMKDPKQKISTLSVGISEKEGPLLCRVSKRVS
ncbi:hypothetical protein NM208_g10348 [Fusarium decemcellulare]|uniref:Uncharacterized protein n=1 Tax=Fusarium decemcellulare TaxID=57161 RepID=A0ACC1RY64_9HYPO|nr:hypothetical protein NM208_g10348 [Fusarium decemcellulare]